MKTLILLSVATTSALLFFWLKPAELNADTSHNAVEGIMKCPFTGAVMDKDGKITHPDGTVQTASEKPAGHP